MIKKLYIIFACVFFLTGCSLIDSELSKVETPNISKTPIDGKWTVSKTIFKEDIKEKTFEYKKYIGKEAIFSKSGVIIGEDFSKNSRYKAKKVKADLFLEEKYGIKKSALKIDSDFLYVVQIFDKDELFYEVIRSSEDTAYIYINGVFLQLKKISSQVDEKELSFLINQKNNKSISGQEADYDSSENGFLLGIKYSDKNPEDYKYKTYYFKFNDNKVDTVKEIENLVLPKQNRNVEVVVENEKTKLGVQDKIVLKETSNNGEKVNLIGDYSEFTRKEIVYLSDNYINFLEKRPEYKNKNRLNLFYLEASDGNKQIVFSDIIKDGARLYEELAMSATRGQGGFYDDSNIGFKRENGYWKLIGNVSFKNSDKKNVEIELNSLLPKDFYKYPNMTLSMQEIRRTIPNVEDAFITPNNKFLIVLENNEILIYNIENGKINEKIISQIKIPKDSKVVMTQYAIGRNSKLWEKQLSVGK